MSKFLDSPFIEITPEMIEAGVDRYQELAEGFSEDYIVREILEAGLKVLEKRQADSPTIRAMAHV